MAKTFTDAGNAIGTSWKFEDDSGGTTGVPCGRHLIAGKQAVGVFLGVGVFDGVLVGSGVRVGVLVGVRVAVAVEVGVKVAVGTRVAVAVGTGVCVAVGGGTFPVTETSRPSAS